ncbi:hypothetical protein B0H34DRAFT_665821 [Crassisporium funariophilum]|nr:hypothetical protein B0H34DRAFT_665821 [Crassisporium funariophilum]
MIVPSLSEFNCAACGFHVIFLPKFHCKLNPIKQCWGYSKRTYQRFPTTSKEDDLERNVILALESVPLLPIQQFVSHTRHFMDGYCKGLDGCKAAWASKKYRGH